MKTKLKLEELTQMIKEISILSAGIYLGLTLGIFSGTYFGTRDGARTFRVPKEERIWSVNDELSKYNLRSWPIQVLTFGEYLAFKLYQVEINDLPNSSTPNDFEYHGGGISNTDHPDGTWHPNGAWYHGKVIPYDKMWQGTWKMQSNEYRLRVMGLK